MNEAASPLMMPLIILASMGYGFLVFWAKQNTRKAAIKYKPRDYAFSGIVIVGVIITYFVLHASGEAAKKQMLREHFSLSDDIELVEFEFIQGGRRPGAYDVHAVYRFTDEQLRSYRARLKDPAQWGPHLFEHGGRTITGLYTYEARRWNDFPRPLRAADVEGMHAREFPWLYHLWWRQDWQNIKNGKIMCFLFEKVNDGRNPAIDPYKVSACSQRPKSTHIRASVFAIVDFDRKTLSVSID